MVPIRLLLVAILVYVGWRMLRRGRRGNAEELPRKPPHAAEPQDTLVEDPVCHVLIPKHQALRLRRNGVTYYFCSERCCDQFVEQMEKEKEQGEE
ncbi:YHS domain-containing protein [Desulfobulbus propionicus]|jgi:YHS domain-containing protein